MRISESKLRRLIRSVIKESNMMDQSVHDVHDKEAITILEHYLRQLDQAYEKDAKGQNPLENAFDAFYGHKTSDILIGFNYMLTKIADIFESIIGISSNRFFASSSPLGRELVNIKINIKDRFYRPIFRPENEPIHTTLLSIRYLVEEVVQKIKDGSLSLFEDEDVV